MTTIRRYTNRIEEFLHSDNGQRFFNIAYSVGAAIVIWGALFKILHLPGGNTLLCVGMGTEIAMFILTAFDRPPKEPNWEEIVPAMTGQAPQGKPGDQGVQVVEDLTIVDDSGSPIGMSSQQMNDAAEKLEKANELAEATNRFVDAIEGISKQMSELHDAMASGSNGYAERMADLNRNLAGLNTIYEIQLRSMSGQLEAIDRVNRGLRDIRDMYERSANDSAKYCEESEKMAKYMQQINEVYARMISALTITAPMGVNTPVHTSVNPEQEKNSLTS